MSIHELQAALRALDEANSAWEAVASLPNPDGIPTPEHFSLIVAQRAVIEAARRVAEGASATPQAAQVPAGYALVPMEATEAMQIAGFESEAWDALSDAVIELRSWPYSCRESAECVSEIYTAMLAAAQAQGVGRG